MPESPGPSWKHSAGQAPRGAAGRPGASRKAWQPGRPQATRGPVDPRVKYRRRLIAATLSGAVLVALVIGLILWWGPYKRPTLVVVAPDAPDSTVAPSNSAGAAGARSFYDAFRSARESPRPKSEPNSTAGVGDWQQAIDDSSAPLFLYFACPGAADRSGPYLWLVPAGAGIASATEQRLTITQVLNHLKTLPARRQKVLVLDAATEPVSWTRGHLHNDFARRLKALDAEIKAVPNLVVICSADDDQRSWVSEEWRQTAFGHYLQEGLKGAAGSANARVSAFELFGYVQKAVSQWAQANRDTQQTPILLPSQDADDTRNGESRAKNIEIATRGSDSYVARAPSEAPGYRFTVPDALRTAWERYDELEKSKDLSAQPETKAPNLWRQYLDLLLRAEHAARVTGDVPEPIVLKLRQLADQLAAPLWGAPPACMPFSLPAGPALGYRRPELRPEQFQVLWGHAKPADAWDELIRGKDVDRARLTVADSLVRYLQTQAPDRAALDRAEKLLEVVEVGKGRPVETHLVRTFRQHLAANQDPKLVRQAIAVQVEAERAAWYAGPGTDYPYAEQVALWFRQDLEVADKHRRDGTDLVFAGDAKSAAAAAKDLDAAQELYRALAEKAAALGAAYRLRDRALTRLPYYARWAAGRRVRTDEAQPELDRITQIAEKAHALADLLTAPDPGQLREVGRLVAELNGPDGLFRKLETDFQTSLARLSDQALPANWYALDNTLNVPFIPVRTRMDLLEKLRLVSRQLHENADPQDARPGGPVSPKEMAQRQGKMALAILGERRFTEFRGASLTWKEVSQRVDAPALGAWWDSLAEAGERVGETFSAIARGADERGRGLSGETEAGITQAAALARLADGATVLNGNSPAAERRFRMHQLLIAQAVRAAADGWESLDKGSSQPYCLAAATSYLESAKAVLQGGPGSSMPPGWLKAINNAEAGLRHGKFDLTFPRDHIYMTDRAEERLWFGVRSTDGPNGKPVVRVAAATAPVASKDIPANEYRPLGDFASPGVRSGENLLNLSAVKAPDGTKGRVELDLLYRGRLVRRSIEAEQAEPTYHWIFHPPTGKASIVVKGDAALRSGAVAVMFDMSKSMNELDKQTESRKVRAANAVRKMLAEMPEETIVSVSFFAGKGSQIETFQPPTRWSDAATKAEAVFEKVSKRPADGGVTPLSESIVTALNGLEVLPGKDFTGFRSLIIITDGCDTAIDDINRPATSKPGEALLKQLTQGPAGNAANNPDVAVHLVLFGGDKDDMTRAYTQFGAIAEHRHYREGRTPAQIWPSKEEFESGRMLEKTDELAAKLKEAMLPYTTIQSEDGEIVRRHPTTVASDQFFRWLTPMVPADKAYRLSAMGLSQKVELRPGDRLIFELLREGRQSRFTLPSWTKAYGATGVPGDISKDGTVRLTVPKNLLTQLSNTYDLELTATLERPIERFQPDQLLIRHLPLFAWFEVTPQNADKDRGPRALRVENLHGRVAPAWTVRATGWMPRNGEKEVAIAPARARLEAYWLDTEPQAKDTLEFAKLTGEERELSVDGVKVTVDRDLTVDKEGYLTVRLTHEPRKPVLVRAKIGGTGSQWALNEDHKFFDKANQYTAVFGPLRAADLNALTLEFYSLDSIKGRAKHATVDLPRAPSLTDQDVLPEPNLKE